jgi:hypothetical protein
VLLLYYGLPMNISLSEVRLDPGAAKSDVEERAYKHGKAREGRRCDKRLCYGSVPSRVTPNI